MKIHKFENIYPRTFWIANCSKEYPWELTKKFNFYENTPGWQELATGINNELDNAAFTSIAACYPVEEKATGKIGVLLTVFQIDEMDQSLIAHESVHIADYFYEACGCNSEDFTDGNEAYAYLVGWAAGCIANVLIKEKDGKTK